MTKSEGYVARLLGLVLVVKKLPANVEDVKRCGFDSWAGEILWRRVWQPTSVFLPEESHRQRSLAGYTPQGPTALWVSFSWTPLRWLRTHKDAMIAKRTQILLHPFGRLCVFILQLVSAFLLKTCACDSLQRKGPKEATKASFLGHLVESLPKSLSF